MAGNIILHIGTPKTASSALQLFLKTNREKLKEAGFCYPLLGTPADTAKADSDTRLGGNGSKLKKEFYKSRDGFSKESRGYYNEITQCVNQYENTIISEENFVKQGTEVFYRNFQSTRAQVKAVIYLRRQDRYLESLWSYRVKAFSDFSIPLAEFVKDEAYLEEIAADYYKKLEEIASYIGKENIIVRSYDHLEGDIYRDFLTAAGCPWNDEYVLPKGKINVKLDHKYIELKRRVNGLAVRNRELVRDIVTAHQNREGKKNDRKESFLPSGAHEEICRRYRENNDRIQKEYMGGRLLFSYDFGEEQIAKVSFDELELEKELVEILMEVCKGQEKMLEELESSRGIVRRAVQHFVRS